MLGLTRYIYDTNKIVLCTIFCVFFIGDNVCNTFGVNLPIYKFLLLILCAFSLTKLERLYYAQPQAIWLLLFCFLYAGFKISTGGQAGNTMMGLTVILPVFIYILYSTLEQDYNAWLYKKVLYIAYLVECGVALVERVLHTHIFLWNPDSTSDILDFEVSEFRSYGLYGHPLQNAVVILVFILFILVYERNVKWKFSLSLLGVLAILCFNTRAAIVISSLSLVLYVFYWLSTERISDGIKMITFVSLIILAGSVYYLYSLGLIGGRLSSMGLYDENSAAVRVDALNIFKYYDISDFMFGISQNDTLLLKSRLGLVAVENFWLNWMLGYGIVFVIGLVFFYFPVIKGILYNNSLFEKCFLFFPFIILASTNPSLAVSIVPMTAFLLLSYIMPKSNLN